MWPRVAKSEQRSLSLLRHINNIHQGKATNAPKHLGLRGRSSSDGMIIAKGELHCKQCRRGGCSTTAATCGCTGGCQKPQRRAGGDGKAADAGLSAGDESECRRERPRDGVTRLTSPQIAGHLRHSEGGLPSTSTGMAEVEGKRRGRDGRQRDISDDTSALCQHVARSARAPGCSESHFDSFPAPVVRGSAAYQAVAHRARCIRF
jgi:hypothetical protein